MSRFLPSQILAFWRLDAGQRLALVPRDGQYLLMLSVDWRMPPRGLHLAFSNLQGAFEAADAAAVAHGARQGAML